MRVRRYMTVQKRAVREYFYAFKTTFFPDTETANKRILLLVFAEAERNENMYE